MRKKKSPSNFYESPTPHTHTHLSKKMIQWLNVRAVGAIKARPFEERTPLPAPPSPCLFLFLSLSSSFTSRRQPERRPGWRADAQGLSLRLGPPCQLGAFPPPPSLPTAVASEGSFFPLPPSLRLSSSSHGQPRPYRAAFPPSRPLATIPTLSLRIAVRQSGSQQGGRVGESRAPSVRSYLFLGGGGGHDFCTLRALTLALL